MIRMIIRLVGARNAAGKTTEAFPGRDNTLSGRDLEGIKRSVINSDRKRHARNCESGISLRELPQLS